MKQYFHRWIYRFSYKFLFRLRFQSSGESSPSNETGVGGRALRAEAMGRADRTCLSLALARLGRSELRNIRDLHDRRRIARLNRSPVPPERMKAMKLQFHHMNLCSENVSRLSEFYRSVLDLDSVEVFRRPEWFL